MGVDVSKSQLLDDIPAERRYLTISFYDLVGYTQLSEGLDPEELRQVQIRYQNLVLAVVERYGGFVARYSGDGILVYFGYPAARENDPERAVRAALEVVERVPRMATGLATIESAPLALRVGIHTGLVVIGSEMASGGRADHSVVGEAVNLAARLQTEAPPDSVVVSGETRNLIEGLFDTQALGLKRLKGLTRMIQVYRIVSVRPVGDRIYRLRGGATKLVGRDPHLDQLTRCWRATKEQSHCQTMYVIGEAGVGKTRLVLDFSQSAASADAAVLQINCDEFLASTPLNPVASLLWTRAGLLATDPADERTEKLSNFLRELGLESSESLDVVNTLMALLLPGSIETSAPTALQLKLKQFDFLLSMLERIARMRPTLLWIDDAQWLDWSTAELLVEAITRLRELPILFVLTMRSLPTTPRLPSPQEVMILRQLRPEEAMEVARSVPGAEDLPRELLEIAIAASDGIPLFIEQLVLSVVNNELHSGASPTRKELPLTLAEVLSARLDRLADSRRIVQTAACIGRTFTPNLLAAVLPSESAGVLKSLENLVAAEILQPRHDDAESHYEFRHALIERAARDSMLQSDRRTIHSRIAETLRRQPTPPLPELVAHHLAAAEKYEEAAAAWLEAAAAATKRYAQIEAIEHIRRGLAALDHVSGGEKRRALELNLQAALIGPLTASSGPTTPALDIACSRGIELCKEGEPSPLIFAFIFGQFVFANSKAHTQEAISLANMFLGLAERQNFMAGRVVGHRLLGMALLGRGDAQEAADQLQRSLELYSPDRDAAMTQMFGQNTQVHSQSLLSLALLCIGDIELSVSTGYRALAAADEIRNPHSTALAIAYVGCFLMGLVGVIEPARSSARRLIALAEQHRLQIFRIFGEAFLGWAHCCEGDLARGVSVLEHAIADFERIDYRLTVAVHLARLADARRQLGDFAAAKAASERALEMIADGGDRWLEPEVRRVAGLVMRDAGQKHDAEVMLRAAVTCANGLGFPMFEYRALCSLQDTIGHNTDASAAQRLRELSRFEDVAGKVARLVNLNERSIGEPGSPAGRPIATSVD
jgi:class 3 adenylate cyclase/tetratricopeptide (TPR) repeat protein